MGQKRDKTRSYSLRLFIALFISLMVIAYVSEYSERLYEPGLESLCEGWRVTFKDSEGVTHTDEMTCPCKIDEEISEEGLVISNTLPLNTEGSFIFLQSNHQNIEVYIDGVFRDSYGKFENLEFGKVSPLGYMPIKLTEADAGKTIEIHYNSYYQEYRFIIKNVYFGSYSQFLSFMRDSFMTDIILGAMFIVGGTLLFVIYFVLYYMYKKFTDINYLGYFGIMMGFYIIFSCTGRQLIVSDILFAEKASYILRGGLIIPILQFVGVRLNRKYKRITAGLIFLQVLTVLTEVVLDLFKFVDISILSSINPYMIAFYAVYIVFILLMSHKKGETYFNKEFYWGIGLFVFSVILNNIIKLGFGINSGHEDDIIYVGAYLMVIIICSGNIKNWIEIEKARKDAENSNKAKSDFLANMSHEIRTPINAVIGMNEMILRETESDSIRKYANKVKNASNILLSLVNDILDFSKIESGKMELFNSEYEIVPVLYDVVNMAKTKLGDKNIEFILDISENIPTKLFGDDVRIRQVLTNILSNAVKYTRQGSIRFKVECRYEQNDTEHIVLRYSVKDTGIGIKQEDMETLFESFRRLDEKANHSVEGTGLGMCITNSFLKLMDSRLNVESTYGKGSEFWFEIKQAIIDDSPIGDFNQATKISDVKDISVHSKFIAPDAHILVVDDNEMNLEVIQGLLKETKMQITVADRGAKALELVRNADYNLVLLDHMMPGMDGIETLKRMRGVKPDLPIIALTANAISGAREMYLSCGFQDYLVKPIDIFELESVLRKYIPSGLILDKTEAEMRKMSKVSSEKEDDNNYVFVVDKQFFNDKYTINIDEGLKFSMSSYSKYCTMLEAYIKFEVSRREKIEKAFNSTDMDAYAIEVHALKSNAKGIGAFGLADAALKHEMAAKNSDAVFVNDNYDNLFKEMDLVLEGVKQLISDIQKMLTNSSLKIEIGNDTISEKEPVRTIAQKEESRQKYVNQLLKFVEDYDRKAGKGVIKTWLKEEREDTIKVKLGIISDLLEDFEFEKARDEVKKIGANLS